MPAKHTSHEHIIFIMAISITMAHWLNWILHNRACPIIPRIFTSDWLTSKGVRVAGKTPYETLERACELDPRNLNYARTISQIVTDVAPTYADTKIM